MDYREAVAYLLSFADFERSSGERREAEGFALTRIQSLLRRLGEPQDGRLSVHVAGSKGKGSTAAMIESILRAGGQRTGLFTSPHLHEFRERIEINGEPLAEQAFADLLEKLRPAIEEELAENPGRLSTFEILTAMGYAAFREHEVEAQVIEVGIGGRLDCTNVIKHKAAAVITALSFEHTEVLGDDLRQIAGEKAGIITAGTDVAVLAPQRSGEAAAMVREHADDVPSPIVDVAERYGWEPAGVERWGQWFRVERKEPRPTEAEASLLLTPLLGRHQIENAVTALATVDALVAGGLRLEDGAHHAGLATVDWPGRLEALDREPWLVVDGAHNLDSLERVLEAYEEYYPHERLIVVLGLLGDKALREMAARIRDRAEIVVVTQPHHPRARSAVELAESFADWEGRLFVEPDVEAALSTARRVAGEADLIGVLGSLFVAAEVRAAVRSQAGVTPTSAHADR